MDDESCDFRIHNCVRASITFENSTECSKISFDSDSF